MKNIHIKILLILVLKKILILKFQILLINASSYRQLDIAAERISEVEHSSTENYSERQRDKKYK